ncbi:MAG TPA: FAD-binding oxidoreductase, partial [Propionibacteriaceae bacterium]|nr:FAD-binding oxidoreductase [Propionibacteriaceae bacterium]
MSSSNAVKVAVVGGGVIGVSTAQQLVRAGADVVLVTEGELASNASGRSLSWLNSAGIRSESYHRLRMAGIDRYRTLAAQHPGLDWLRFDGGLAWQAADQAEQLHSRHEHEAAHGYDSQLLSSDQVATYTTGVNPAAIPKAGAIWNAGEGWVDLPCLVRFLATDFVERGGQLVTNAGRCTIMTDAGSVVGVRTGPGGAFPAQAAV